jgi:hypothetical protein
VKSFRFFGALTIALACGCASSPAGKSAAPAAATTKAPYDAPPAGGSTINITLDARAAREILESLGRPRMDLPDVKLLEDLPAVRYAIQDSTRTPDVFERDFAAAFGTQASPAVFDFRSIRERRDRLQALLDGILARQDDLLGLSRRRAASLLPGDRNVSASLHVYFSFGLAGLEDDLIVRTPEGGEAMVIDFGRVLGDAVGEKADLQISRLSRLIAGAAFRLAWNAYREESPAWRKANPQLGQFEPLLKLVAAGGPIGLFTIDENFFPLSVWLKEPMKRAVDDLNRRVERFASAQENLEERVSLTTEIRRPEFARQVAAPIGAFLTDAIAEDAGVGGLRSALQEGPLAFFLAYDRATQHNKDLIPLAKPIRDKLK